ncbi:helix-turn-helix domain-containing protein [Pontiella sp.]|uniref:helix-turn-helix domain-containing protein n=1 Tax=Pontiella sp. TaxID=2837462 RepID=UPI003566E357
MSIIKSLQAEIIRVARKEIKKELEPVKRVNATQRGLIANLRRDVTDLQKEVARLQRELGKAIPEQTEEPVETKEVRITGKGILSLRKRLVLTQAEFAKLAGVSTPSVVKWEKQEGILPFRRKETADRIQTVRGMGKKEAWAELGKEK